MPDGVVHTSVPMRPFPTGMPSSLREVGFEYRRSPRETNFSMSTARMLASFGTLCAAAAVVEAASDATKSRLEGLVIAIQQPRHQLPMTFCASSEPAGPLLGPPLDYDFF